MKKKLFLILAVLATAINASAYDFEVDGIYYNIISKESQTCEVTNEWEYYESYHKCYFGDIVIPSTVTYKEKTITVTAIGEYAFQNCSSLTSVTIPNSVTTIGKSAFYKCSSLTSVEIPNSVTSIGDCAFSYCKSLTSVEIPNSVTSIGDGAFFGCSSLTSATIPNSVTKIGINAFGCSNLTSVTIPNTIKTIAERAFSYCTSLTSVTIPNSVTSIGEGAFFYCKSLTSVEIPNSVTSIGKCAFLGCDSLKSVTIPNSVTSIGDKAFEAYNLKSVILTDGMTKRKAKRLYRWGYYISFINGEDTPKFDPKAFPVLEISEILFADNGNKKIDALETCKLKIKVTNTGKGAAVGCVAKTKISGAAGLTAKDVKLPTIAQGKTVEVDVELLADATLRDGMAEISVSVDEPHGFGCDPTLLNVETQAFVAPKVLIADYSITGMQGATLEKRKPFDLQVLLQNAAQGVADDVFVAISVPQNVLITEGDESTRFARLSGGETKSMVYQLLVNNNYSATTIPVKFTLKEKYGKYAESRTINLALNQSLAQNKIDIKGEAERQRANIELAKIEGGVKQSDVDLSIPQNAADNRNTFAVVIANENYQDVEKVANALNDGQIFAEYCQKTLGLPEKNVHLVKDATLNNIKREINWASQVSEAFGGEAKVIFYYAGHGVPDERTQGAFLLPIDGLASDVSTNYSLADLYSELGKMNTKLTLVLLDACFSGSQRGDGMLMAARGVAIKPKTEPVSGNMVVFSAAQGTETAYPYIEKGHGLFTYFLLKKLQESNGDVALNELSEYITTNVVRCSIVENGKSQTPATVVSKSLGDTWKTWKLK